MLFSKICANRSGENRTFYSRGWISKSVVATGHCVLKFLAAPLRKVVAKLSHFHDGIVLDDMRDFYFCERHQEKLQGKVDTEVEFASTPSGQCAFSKWLWRVPVVLTANLTTTNRDLLETSDFLANTDNRVLVTRTAPPT